MPKFLIVESETSAEREARRASAGKSAGESFAATLTQLVPAARCDFIAPAEEGSESVSRERLGDYDAVFLSGSPLHVYEDAPEVRRQLALMRAVFAAGTPSFGSCAGLQVAVAAAGGKVRPAGKRREAGIARRIRATTAGQGHPLLAGRPSVWDAFSIHGDEVEQLPADAVLLAGNDAAVVQAAEIRHDRGVFWGVQYHPELSPGEIAAALERQGESLAEQGLGKTDIDDERALLNRLHHDPADRAARWRLGIDGQVADEALRRTEIQNFLDGLERLRR